jgi:hypothetical protein
MTPNKLQEIKNYIDTLRIIRRNVENNSEAFYEDKLLAALYYDYVELEINWNKLKEYIRKTKLKEFEKSYGKRYGKTFTQAELIVCNMILDKMQELEQGSDSNENN